MLGRPAATAARLPPPTVGEGRRPGVEDVRTTRWRRRRRPGGTWRSAARRSPTSPLSTRGQHRPVRYRRTTAQRVRVATEQPGPAQEGDRTDPLGQGHQDCSAAAHPAVGLPTRRTAWPSWPGHRGAGAGPRRSPRSRSVRQRQGRSAAYADPRPLDRDPDHEAVQVDDHRPDEWHTDQALDRAADRAEAASRSTAREFVDVDHGGDEQGVQEVRASFRNAPAPGCGRLRDRSCSIAAFADASTSTTIATVRRATPPHPRRRWRRRPASHPRPGNPPASASAASWARRPTGPGEPVKRAPTPPAKARRRDLEPGQRWLDE